MPAPDRIKQLVETFEQNINEYHSGKNETELRRQFLDPFFEALGWDVDNKQGKDERNKEVAHEYSVEIDGQQKKADYAFRVDKESFDFLVEAKKPSVRVENSLEAAYQIRRYGWSAKIPINILTDFEHFAIYDCRTRPNYSKDKAATGRISIFHYKEYIEKWDEIAALFSADAIRNGALEKYKDELKGKKGTQEVDDAFLEEIEGWREALAKNIATRNKDKNLNEDQINFAVQMTIDRIIFLRIAEERGMEKDRRLFELSDNTGIYKDLLKFFQQADDRYNSGLFHFRKDKERENPDVLSSLLEIDDKVLKDIITDLYYPSPYAFNYIPTEILGSVYERFLGKVIRLTAGGNAKVEEKPEVRKAGGVYYTPAYIVEYIVKNTVGKIVNGESGIGLTPDEVSKLKIVDPACGSGSFLLGAYQFLLDWHLDWYVANSADKWIKNKVILTADNKTYRLSMAEKKRILLNNIHGVDLDPQAVEVTKLSLLLKVVEDPGQLKMFEEGHILPNLNQNIKNGNALIGTDYFSGQMFGNMDEMKRVKPFDWQTEFPEVFRRGGFDVVVGNPPYGFHQIHSDNVKPYFKNKFSSAFGSYENYFLFYEQSLSLLNKKGSHGFIVPVTWLTIPSAKALREYILKSYRIKEILWLSDQVFENAQVNTLVAITYKESPSETLVKICDTSDNLIRVKEERVYKQQQFIEGDYYIGIFETADDNLLLERLIQVSQPLKNFARPCSGYNPYEVGKGQAPNGGLHTKDTVKTKPYHSTKKLGSEWKPEIVGRDLSRYSIHPTGERWIKYGSWLAAARESTNFSGKRLLVQEITGGQERRIIAAYCEDELYYSRDVIPVKFDTTDANPFYILGIVNSKLITWYHHRRNPKAQKALFPKVLVSDLATLPIRAINFNDPAEKSMHEQMVKLVEQMLALHKSLAAAKNPQESELIQRQVKSTDRGIDELVYKLYELTEEEIKIIEG